MNQDQMKSLLLRDKGFLKLLYEGNNPLKNKKVLQTAEDSELNTLIKFLHFLSNGEITFKKNNFKKIQESHKLQLIQNKVEKKSKLFKLLKSPRKEKLKFLNQLQNIYNFVLDCLFNAP